MEAPVAQGRPRVLYVCGWGRSGTTVVDRVLGELPGFVSLGELRSLWDFDPATHLCGCGAAVVECELWGPALQRVLPRPEIDGFAAVRRLRDHSARSRHLPNLWRRGRAGSSTDRRGADDAYGQLLADLYRSVLATAGGRVVVDSSKHPAEAMLLASRADLELTVLHLVRDPRGVAYSWGRRLDPSTGERPPERGALSSSAWWSAWNATVEWMLAPGLGERYVRRRYEDLMSSARAELGAVARLIGADAEDLPFTRDDEVALHRSHTVAGNPNRMQAGDIRLSVDRRWESEMTSRERRKATVPALPLLAHYRYALRAHRRSPVAAEVPGVP